MFNHILILCVSTIMQLALRFKVSMCYHTNSPDVNMYILYVIMCLYALFIVLVVLCSI